MQACRREYVGRESRILAQMRIDLSWTSGLREGGGGQNVAEGYCAVLESISDIANAKSPFKQMQVPGCRWHQASCEETKKLFLYCKIKRIFQNQFSRPTYRREMTLVRLPRVQG